MDSKELREMIKSWWAEKSTSEKQIIAEIAVITLGVFCWLAVIKPIDTYIEEHQKKKKKIRCGTGGDLARSVLLACGDKPNRYVHC